MRTRTLLPALSLVAFAAIVMQYNDSVGADFVDCQWPEGTDASCNVCVETASHPGIYSKCDSSPLINATICTERNDIDGISCRQTEYQCGGRRIYYDSREYDSEIGDYVCEDEYTSNPAWNNVQCTRVYYQSDTQANNADCTP